MEVKLIPSSRHDCLMLLPYFLHDILSHCFLKLFHFLFLTLPRSIFRLSKLIILIVVRLSQIELISSASLCFTYFKTTYTFNLSRHLKTVIWDLRPFVHPPDPVPS